MVNLRDALEILLHGEYIMKPVSDGVFLIGKTSYVVFQDDGIKIAYEIKTSDGVYPKTKKITYKDQSLNVVLKQIKEILNESIDKMNVVIFTINSECYDELYSFLLKYSVQIQINKTRSTKKMLMFEVDATHKQDINDFILVNDLQRGLDDSEKWNGFKDWFSGLEWRKKVGRE